MSNSINLTAAEVTALKECLNYGDRESQLSDNMSNGGMEEFRAALKWNKHQVAGLISSLEQKGLGDNDEEEDIFWISEEGVNAIFDIIENEN